MVAVEHEVGRVVWVVANGGGDRKGRGGDQQFTEATDPVADRKW